jgi:citrate synthase
MKKNGNANPLFLSAKEAAAELSISLPTLYAYVSRGFIRSEAAGEARTRRYRADDVRALKSRRAPPTEEQGMNETALDWGVPVLESAVSAIDDLGMIYRGVPALALAETATFENVATLLWEAEDEDPFAAPPPVVSKDIADVMRKMQSGPAIERAMVMLAMANGADAAAFNRSKQGRLLAGARVVRLATAAIIGASVSAAPIHRQIADAWLPGLSGAKKEAGADLLRRSLVLLADHELNASTFTVRVAASTGVNLYDSVIAGLCAVKGPRHGGVGISAARLVEDLTVGDPVAVIRERLAMGERLPGFGHQLYRASGDPRAKSLLSMLKQAPPRLLRDAPDAVYAATGVWPNIDYALAVMCRTLSLPAGSEQTIFALGRTAGWIAHAIEQYEQGGLIRPRARYIGPAARA